MDAREDREAWARTGGAQTKIVNQQQRGGEVMEHRAAQRRIRHSGEMAAAGGGTPRSKAIPPARERLQSRLLVAFLGTILIADCTHFIRLGVASSPSDHSFLVASSLSLTFGLVVWVLRAATPAAALWGSIICLTVTCSTEGPDRTVWHSGLAPLLALFALTFLATRMGHKRKQRLELAESDHGRNAAQVIANLGVAAVAASVSYLPFTGLQHGQGGHFLGPTLLLAALAEATADTLSSEIGQAFGGTPRLITRLGRVASGTDGAISLLGTSAGVAGAALIATVGSIALRLSVPSALIAFAAAVAGLFFDSLLGATVERRGWLGNDLVNFSSTAFAAVCAALLMALR